MEAACRDRHSEQRQTQTYPSRGRPGPCNEGKCGYCVRSRHSYVGWQEHGSRHTTADSGSNRGAHAEGPSHPCHLKPTDAGAVKRAVSAGPSLHHSNPRFGDRA
jgi:hypothetical protein